MKRRFCELNVVEQPTFAENLQNIKQVIKLGYHVVAINRKLKPPEKSNKHTKKQVCVDVEPLRKLMVKLQSEIDTWKAAPQLEFTVPHDFELLSRVTIELENSDQVGLVMKPQYKEILDFVDIIALSPQNEVVFKSIVEGKLECDIIALQLQNELKFKPTREMIGLAWFRKISFEVCYSHAIKSVSLRKYVFKNGRLVVERSRKLRGIILCAAGEQPMDFRSPKDVINLAHLFGVNDNVCYDIVSKNSLEVVTRAKLRKFTFKGAVVVEVLKAAVVTEEEVEVFDKTLGINGQDACCPLRKKQKI